MVQLQKSNPLPAAPGLSWRAIGPSACVLLLGACAALGPPDIATSRVYQGLGADALYAQTLQALRASELEITGSDRASGRITAVGSFEDRGWAACDGPLRIVENQQDQEQVVEAREDYRRVELTASVEGAGQGARLTLDPDYRAEPVSALATEPECRTTGVLERQILDAVAAAT
jgi:hypothetical protein